MAKVMLVEDDNNLREIYGARLQAEGYEIVSAKDGEEALALAVKEKPNLIISDIMMPKISGFDMLDILHSTPETKNTKVIMMTALSQTEDKDHASKLGADRYLVKSQVTLEDVVRVAKEVLAGSTEATPAAQTDQPAPSAPTTDTTPVATPSPATAPAADSTAAPSAVPSEPVAGTPATAGDTSQAPMPPPPPDVPPKTAPASPPTEPQPNDANASGSVSIPVTSADEDSNSSKAINDKVLADAVAKVSASSSAVDASASSAAETSEPVKDSAPPDEKPARKVIEPLNDLSEPKKDIHELVAQEEAKEQVGGQTQNPVPHAPDTTITPTTPSGTSQNPSQ